jgi:uncharacterized protein
MEIRDPIHGAIRVDPAERAVVDHPFLQRLRGIRATGFSSTAFPSATHTRYAHSLGVMHLAGRAFDVAYRDWTFSRPTVRHRLRAAVRLAALCHDLGHSPFSHCTEFAMPPLRELRIPWYGPVEPRRATHEDYTIAILANTDLAATIRAHTELTARHVAALVSPDVTLEDDGFVDQGLDHRRILSQIVSSELDVDRLDYLVRDSVHSGARYGQVDVDWLVSHLLAHPLEGRVTLALDARALYAFDDFLIARHHMFLMVYFHHKSVVYEELLKRFVREPGCDWSLSGDLERYLWQDDLDLIAHLRRSDSPWARRIVERRPFRRVLEVHGTPADVDLSAEVARLREAGIDVIEAGSTGRLSRYEVYGQKRRRAPRILVVEKVPSAPPRQAGLPGLPVPRAVRALERATAVFQRYADARRVARIFVSPEDEGRARHLLGLTGPPA